MSPGIEFVITIKDFSPNATSLPLIKDSQALEYSNMVLLSKIRFLSVVTDLKILLPKTI